MVKYPGKHFTDLILEVTRRCNLECNHCLRGCQENIDIKKETIDILLESTDSISSITFTGGEPVLVPEIIIYTIDEIMTKKIEVDHFYMVTNATIFNKDLFFKLIEFYWYCGEKEYCCIACSIDQYHYNYDTKNREIINKWKCLSFYSNDKEHNGDYKLISEGYANDNNIGNRDLIILKEKFIIKRSNDDLYFEDLVYINVHGQVLNDCNMSYRTQLENILGTVENDDYYIIEEENE